MPPPMKRRRIGAIPVSAVEEVTFDPSARQEYLTGFHKRKLARAKYARELAEKKEREERIRERKRLREGRREEVRRRVEEVNASISRVGEDAEGDGEDRDDDNGSGNGEVDDDSGSDDDEGADAAESNRARMLALGHEDEYIDEDKFTTVLVEEVDVDRDGLHRSRPEVVVAADGDDGQDATAVEVTNGENKDRKCIDGKRAWSKEKPKDAKSKPKPKRKKFRYENKAERKFTREKERSKNRKQASARRKGE